MSGKTRQMHIRIREDEFLFLQRVKAETGFSMSDTVRATLRKGMASYKKRVNIKETPVSSFLDTE